MGGSSEPPITSLLGGRVGTYKEYIDRLYPQLESLSRSFATKQQGEDDILQEALGAAWRVWCIHHQNKNTVELCKIGYRAVRNEIIDKATRYHQAYKRIPADVLVEIDADWGDTSSNLFEAVDLKLDIENLRLSRLGKKVLQEIVNPAEKTVRLATDWRNNNHQKYIPWESMQPKVYAQSLGVSPDMVTVALEEVRSKIRTLGNLRFIEVEGENLQMDRREGYMPDPLDFEEGSLVPGEAPPEEEVWDPSSKTDEKHDTPRPESEEKIIDLDNIPEVGVEDLADLGKEPKNFETLRAKMPPESRARAEKATDAFAAGLRPGSKIARLWDWLQPDLAKGPVTREKIRIAASCALGLEKDKAANWARRAVEDLRKKGLLERVERDQYRKI